MDKISLFGIPNASNQTQSMLVMPTQVSFRIILTPRPPRQTSTHAACTMIFFSPRNKCSTQPAKPATNPCTIGIKSIPIPPNSSHSTHLSNLDSLFSIKRTPKSLPSIKVWQLYQQRTPTPAISLDALIRSEICTRRSASTG